MFTLFKGQLLSFGLEKILRGALFSSFVIKCPFTWRLHITQGSKIRPLISVKLVITVITMGAASRSIVASPLVENKREILGLPSKTMYVRKIRKGLILSSVYPLLAAAD